MTSLMKLLFNFIELIACPESSDASLIDECDMRSESETEEPMILFNQIFGRCFPKLIYLEKIFGFFWPLVTAIQRGADLEGRSAPDPSSIATPAISN